MSDDDYPPEGLVIDNGGYWIKSGIAGDDAPRCLTPTVIKHENSMKSPIKHGIITNKDDMELLWYDIFNNELKIDTSERNILLTDPVHNPISNKEDMVEIMFETFDAPATYIGMHLFIHLDTFCMNYSTQHVKRY